MKKSLWLLLLALLALPALGEEEQFYVSGNLYHGTRLCPLRDGDRAYEERLMAQIDGGGETGKASEILLRSAALTLTEREARELGCFPCPVCVEDRTDYGGLSAVERGGTAVLRVPDAWIDTRERFNVFGTSGDEVYAGDAAQGQLARILHGQAFVDFMETARRDGAAEAEALVPGLYLDDDDLLMHSRHIGGAWYLVLRPGEEARARMKKEGVLTAGLSLEGGPLLWENESLVLRSWGLHYEQEHDLVMEAIDGKSDFSGDFENLNVTLFREMETNILVVRKSPGDGQWLENALLALDGAVAAEQLNGYLDGGDAVYVCVLSDAEAEALKAGAFPRLFHPGRITARVAADDGWQLEQVSEDARNEALYDYTVYFRDGEVWIANNSDAEAGPVSVYVGAVGQDSPGRTACLDGVPVGKALRAFSKGEVSYRTNGETALCAWAVPGVNASGEVISNTDRVWLARVGDEEIYTHTPLTGEGLEIFIDDEGSLYVRNNTGADLDGATVTLNDVKGMVDFIIASIQLNLPRGKAMPACSAEEIAELLAQHPDLETLHAQCSYGGDISDAGAPAYLGSEMIEWSAALYHIFRADGQPAPARNLSFLSGYVDAQQVGDWYLACAGRTGEGIYKSATRNSTANWQLLDGAGNVLADGLRWWPEGEDWPLQPRPFEGFEEGVDVAVLRIGGRYGLIDRAGRMVAEAKYDNIFPFLSGDSSTPMERGGKWGCLDPEGNEVVPPVYDSPFSRFEGGCTVVERGGRKGLLGEDGKELLPAEYGTVWLDEGAEYGMARKGGTCLLFDRQGRILFERELGKNSWIYCYADAEPPFAYYRGEDEKHGYVNLDGTDALPAIYDDASPFWKNSAFAAVELDGGCGFVNRDGSFAVEPMFDWLAGYSDGLCAARRGERWGYIDERGMTVISFKFSHAGTFVNGYADARPLEDSSLNGLIDRSGEWVIEPGDFDNVEVGQDGVAVATKDGRKRYFYLGEGGAEEIGGLCDGTELEAPAALDEAPALSLTARESARLPHLDGIERLYPLYAAFAQAVYPEDVEYESFEQYRDYRSDPALTCTGWDTAWERLANREADVIFVPAPDPEDPVWAMLAGRGETAEFIPLCREAMAFPVNADNPLEGASGEALKAVYAGRVADWSDLGAEGLGRIVAYEFDSGDGGDESRALLERICGFTDVTAAAEGIIGYAGFDDESFTGPAPYRNLPNALGCAPRLSLKPLLDAGEIRLLAVDGVVPTNEHLSDGSYPYVETLYAVTLADNDNPNVKALLDWIQSEQGRELVVKTGYAEPEMGNEA